jgi:molybdate transport system ATP-binding protein
LIRINRKYSLPILVVSHDLPDLLQLTSSLIVVSEGSIIGQGRYADLIMVEKCCALMYGAGLLNVFQTEVLTHELTENTSVLKVQVGNVHLRILCEPCLLSHRPGSYLNVSLRPQDIAISLNYISNISIQNQLAGKVIRIIETSVYFLCVVDVGFNLIAEVTRNAALQLGLVEGLPVYCLFKSVSLKFELV